MTLSLFSLGTLVAHAEGEPEYLVQFLNGDGQKIFLSRQVVAGETAAAPLDYEIAGFTYADPTPNGFENEWLWGGEIYDFNTPVSSDILLVPMLKDRVYVYFVSSGSQLFPIPVQIGTTVGAALESVAGDEAIYPPTRAGYDFDFWSDSADGTSAVATDTIITENIVLYSNWTGVADRTPYKVVYWVEKPNMGVDFVPTPGNTNHYNFGYSPESISGTAGTTVAITTIPAYTTFTDINDPMRYAQFQYSEPTIISGTGSTIVNVYCTLKVYTFAFDLKPGVEETNNRYKYAKMAFRSNPDVAIGEQGYGVTESTRYSFNVKYQQDIINLWPSSANTEFTHRRETRSNALTQNWTIANSSFAGWSTPNEANVNLATHRLSVTQDMLPKDGDTITFTASWESGSGDYQVNYYFERLPEETGGVLYNGAYYVLSGEYSQTFTASSGSLNPKNINGVTVVNPDTQTGNIKNFYYMRNRYNFTYNMQGHGEQVATRTDIMYGRSLAGLGLDVVVPDTQDYAFGGWYVDANCIKPFDFNGNMGAFNQTVFAKWEPTEIYANFVDSNGQPLEGTPYRQGLLRGGTVRLDSVYINGKHYTNGLFVENKGWFDGWDYFPSGLSAKQAFKFDFLVWNNLNLYARWKAEGFRITYHGDGAPTESMLYSLNTKARVLGQGGIVVSEGQTFIGWRDNSKGEGVVYYPGSILTIKGDVNLYPAFTAEQTTTLTFDANFGDFETVTNNFVVNTSLQLPAATVFSNPLRTGYTFSGWNTARDGTGAAYSSGVQFQIGTEPQTLYAQWTENAYTVKYDTNGGTPSEIADKTGVRWGDGDLLPEEPTREGFNFTGWNISPDGSGFSVSSEHTYSYLTGNNDAIASVTLTAQWESKPVYTITVRVSPVGSGIASADAVSASAGTTVRLFATANSGYEFVSWEIDNEGTAITNGTFVMPEANVVVTANFRLIPQFIPTTTSTPEVEPEETSDSEPIQTPTPPPDDDVEIVDIDDEEVPLAAAGFAPETGDASVAFMLAAFLASAAAAFAVLFGKRGNRQR
jgi:uncharacterized repeat protein (TIGR02543 family)